MLMKKHGSAAAIGLGIILDTVSALGALGVVQSAVSAELTANDVISLVNDAAKKKKAKYVFFSESSFQVFARAFALRTCF